MTEDEIARPDPGSLSPRISFIKQTDGSAGHYVRFKDVPEDSLSGGESERKYIPALQHETQEEALRAAIDYMDRRAKELSLPVEAHQGPHTEEAREQMSGYHNCPGLRGLGLTLANRARTIYPQLTAMWSDEGGLQQVRRGMASRGIWKTAELLTGHLREHIHMETLEELARRGAEEAARRLVALAQDPADRKEEGRGSLAHRVAFEPVGWPQRLGPRTDRAGAVALASYSRR
jgi:hypothetical protein